MTWSLLNLWQMSFSGALLIAVIMLIRTVSIHRLPKKMFFALWYLALLRLILPVSFSSKLSVYSWASPEPAILSPIPIPIPTTPTAAPLAAPLQTAPVSIGLVIWFLGALLCFGFFAFAYLRCHFEFQTALPLEHPFISQWLQAHPLKRTIAIRQSDRIDTPLTYGIWRPVILLPRRSNWEDISHLQYVLWHEYSHIRHWDAATKLLILLAVCLHWFNPLVWVMAAFFNRDMELACDETVIKKLGTATKATYARLLIDMQARRSGLAPFCSSFSENAIEERIRSIMTIKKNSLPTLLVALFITLSVAAAFATSAIGSTAHDNAVYGSTIAALDDQTAFALVDLGLENDVLLTSDQLYDCGSEPQAALTCRIFYADKNTVYDLGTLASLSTASPISYDQTGFYTASQHTLERYTIDTQNHCLILAEQLSLAFGEEDEITYIRTTASETTTLTEDDYNSAMQNYAKSAIVHFGYGAAD